MRCSAFLALTFLFLGTVAHAQQAETIGNYTVHYNALKTSELTPQVAQAYGIQRSSSRAFLNITILDTSGDTPTPVQAEVTATARNLTGQSRSIDMREINEAGEAIYYIGEFGFNNMETFTFQVSALVEGRPEPLELSFRQQFYTR